MVDKNATNDHSQFNIKEFNLPETTFVRDVDNKVFHGIILQSLSNIQGIGLLEGNIIDHMLGREEGVKGLHTEQDLKNHSLKVKIEVNIAYGVSIPEKAEEIQTHVAQELTQFTGLHVSEVHVVFKALIPQEGQQKTGPLKKNPTASTTPTEPRLGEEYSDIF